MAHYAGLSLQLAFVMKQRSISSIKR